ncbi:TPA: helix-turn-helix domain-containing protein [Burkholderia cenocepacia]
MDSLITAAARALAAGDALGALNRVALRDDAPALALRGIALAQLGDFERARSLVRGAARAFGAKEAVARARCVVAEADIALASRDLRWPTRALEAACATLDAHGDRPNAAHARYLGVRRLLLIGHLDEAERLLAHLDPAPLPPASRAAHELIAAGIAMRRLRTHAARAALARARAAARAAGIAALTAEVDTAARVLDAPAARLIARGTSRLVPLDEVETLFESNALVAAAFRAKQADESHRARLRVEIGRLRAVLRPLANVVATPRGFALEPLGVRETVVLARPVDDRHAAVLALLADGEAWSSSALALALGASQRTVQRALDSLAETGKVQALGRARARRWLTPPLPGFATTLLLPVALPGD